MSDRVEWLAVGRIVRAHGVRGEVAVLPLSTVESRFVEGARLACGDRERQALTVCEVRPHGHRLLLRFEQVQDRSSAEALRGSYLFVPASDAPPLPEGEFWPHELVGCDVLTEQGRVLGTIREVTRTPANDIWAAEGKDGETLIPALKEVVSGVDIRGRRVIVRDLPGLTTPAP